MLSGCRAAPRCPISHGCSLLPPPLLFREVWKEGNIDVWLVVWFWLHVLCPVRIDEVVELLPELVIHAWVGLVFLLCPSLFFKSGSCLFMCFHRSVNSVTCVCSNHCNFHFFFHFMPQWLPYAYPRRWLGPFTAAAVVGSPACVLHSSPFGCLYTAAQV